MVRDATVQPALEGLVDTTRDFLEWAKTITPLTLPESWFWSYIENHWQCALTQKNKLTYGKMCSGDEQLNLSSLGRMTKAGYLTRGVERFLFAVDSVYKKLCPSQAGLCLDFYENGRRMISSQMMKTTIENEIDIYEYSYTKDNQHQYRTIGNWSLKGGLQLDTLFRNFFNESIKSSCQPPVCKCIIDGDYFQHPLDSFLAKSEHVDIDQSTESYVKREPTFGFEKVAYKSVFEHLSIGQWRHNTYNFFFLFLITALTMIAIAVLVLGKKWSEARDDRQTNNSTEFPILVKMYLRVVKGNQSLGISLLIGIIILYTTAYFFIFDATDVVCRLRLAMHGFGYSLCFGVMIAKATQLRNAEALGFSTTLHISFWNYWLLLFFIIGVQIALNTRWMTESFMSTLAVLETRSEMKGSDRVHFTAILQWILSQSRKTMRNFLSMLANLLETKWLFVSSVLCTLIWLSWVPTYIIISNDLKEKVIVVELICCASVLLGLLFGPKIYILLSYEPVLVVYKENQTTNGMALFEKARAVSPASSTGSSTRSTTATNSSQVFHGTSYNKEQLPIFHTIMRKKNKVRRSQSEHDSEHEMRHEIFVRVQFLIVFAHCVTQPNILISRVFQAHDCSDVVIVQTSPKCVSRGLNES
ncbi:7 transmembrane receptor [Dictyocaulus viviparus]|uniref:7 transmembrane receptor n=1 Tax=Dictyocaulus viviparus TaxID=29172 RepID=A0A0D8YCE9_DICVI|nr:7 transmembrane receptor [Dictyocaulus viviparus]